jgi:hypothetical protein
MHAYECNYIIEGFTDLPPSFVTALSRASLISPKTSSQMLKISVGRRRRTSGRPVETRDAIPMAVSLRCRGSDMLSNYSTTSRSERQKIRR